MKLLPTISVLVASLALCLPSVSASGGWHGHWPGYGSGSYGSYSSYGNWYSSANPRVGYCLTHDCIGSGFGGWGHGGFGHGGYAVCYSNCSCCCGCVCCTYYQIYYPCGCGAPSVAYGGYGGYSGIRSRQLRIQIIPSHSEEVPRVVRTSPELEGRVHIVPARSTRSSRVSRVSGSSYRYRF